MQKITKRKKIHAFKSKMRMEQLEVTQNKRQNAWQQFQTTKGRAKKVCLLQISYVLVLLIQLMRFTRTWICSMLLIFVKKIMDSG